MCPTFADDLQSAADDVVVEGIHEGAITYVVSGGGYDGVSIPDTIVNISDNGAGSVRIGDASESTEVVEGGRGDSYTVVLGTEPSGTVTIVVTPDAQLSVDPLSLIFTTSTWSIPQTVDVSAEDDVVVEGVHEGVITHVVDGGGHDGVFIADAVAHIAYNDASVLVSESEGSTEVAEGGTGDTYTVVLEAEPSNAVTIVVTSDAQLSVNPLSLTFSKTSWREAQTVTVMAVDDVVVEGPHAGTISHSISGGGYADVVIRDVVASTTDNDARVFVVESDGTTTSPSQPSL